jgi:hypothetical protein
LGNELDATLGVLPRTTHLDGKELLPRQMALALLDGQVWAEFDVARDGVDGWVASDDPDARPGTHVRNARLELIIALIHRSLARGQAVVWGSTDNHALLIFGGDYDKAGQPISYLIRDSFSPYTYRAKAGEIHVRLTDMTVVVPDMTSEAIAAWPGHQMGLR